MLIDALPARGIPPLLPSPPLPPRPSGPHSALTAHYRCVINSITGYLEEKDPGSDPSILDGILWPCSHRDSFPALVIDVGGATGGARVGGWLGRGSEGVKEEGGREAGREEGREEGRGVNLCRAQHLQLNIGDNLPRWSLHYIDPSPRPLTPSPTR